MKFSENTHTTENEDFGNVISCVFMQLVFKMFKFGRFIGINLLSKKCFVLILTVFHFDSKTESVR